MKLTSKQIEWINKERAVLKQLIQAKEKDKVYTGLGGDKIRLHQLQIIIDLHNIEVKND